MTATLSRWLTVADVCAFLNLSRSTLKLRRQEVGFPLPVEDGGRVKFVRQEIEAWATAREKAPRRQRIGAKSADGRAVA